MAFREKQIIKVVTGVHRCGKSTLFKLFIDHLLNDGVSKDQIISLNLEDIEYDDLTDYKALYKYVKERLCVGKYTYVFIDEVQNCKDFQKAIDSLHLKENVDVYVTGSNAHMLSGELATLLSGRYVEIKVLPLSFSEFTEWDAGKDLKTQFNDYLKYGSFPYVREFGDNQQAINMYLEGILNSIIVKDISSRIKVQDPSILVSIVKFLMSNIGSLCSIKKICDTLNSNGRKISSTAVENYVEALCDSFIFYKAGRYDIKGKEHLKSLSKFYLVDVGLRNTFLGRRDQDAGYVMENIVYFELLRRGYEVNVGKLAEKEVDFVAQKGDDIIYVQVSATVVDPNTLERELAPLDKIKDHYPKLLITADEELVGKNFNGIKRVNIIDFLANKSDCM